MTAVKAKNLQLQRGYKKVSDISLNMHAYNYRLIWSKPSCLHSTYKILW